MEYILIFLIIIFSGIGVYYCLRFLNKHTEGGTRLFSTFILSCTYIYFVIKLIFILLECK